MKNLLLHILILAVTFSGYSQQGTTTLSEKNILVGEKISLVYTITFPQKNSFKFTPENSIIPSNRKSKTGILSTETTDEIEILTPFTDTVISKGKDKVWIGTYEITAWDSGRYVLAPCTIIIDDSTIIFPSVELTSELVKAKKGQDLYDIKESFSDIPDEPFSLKTFAKNNWWWLLLVVLIPLILIYRNKRKRLNDIPKPVVVLSLKERTLLAIDALEKERLWEKQRLKEHYIELSFILRSYLSSRYEINLLEKTTHETKLLLGQKGLHTETIRVIVSILSEADLVKFAKSQPEELAILKVSHLARQVIAETSPLEFDHAE